MASLNDQYEHGRIPLKPLSFENRNLSQCNEIMVNYGENGDYHIYMTHHNNPDTYIDITALIVKEMLPKAEINANQFTLSIEGNENPQSLEDIINFIWKRFSHAEDPSGFVPETDMDKVLNSSAINVLLQTTDGTVQLPITSADNVYDKNGNNIQSRLDNMAKLGFSTSYLYAEQNNQTSFEFDYPFEDYSDMLEVRVGTTYVDKSRYSIEKHYNAENHYTSGTLNFIGENIENGRRVDLIWIFNTKYDNSDAEFISGGRIADSTIPICKLEQISNSYHYPNSNSIATSKALSDLYTDVSEALNANNQNVFHCADENTSNDNIRVNISRAAVDGDIIIATLAADKKSTVKLSVGATGSSTKTYTIKTPDGNGLIRGFNNNQVIKFKIVGTNAIILSGISNEIRSNKFVYDCADQEYTISFRNFNYNTGDLIHVYRNGVRLFQDLDYSLDTYSQTITLFVRTEEGERIVFESLGI